MDMSQFKDLFVSEALEHLQLLNQKLVELEQNSAASEVLDQIFRSAHTIKGMSATMGYTGLARLAHALEDLLDRVRQGKQAVTSPLMDLLFAGVDNMSALVDDVAADRESKLDIEALIGRLRAFFSTQTETPESAAQTSVPSSPRLLQVQVVLADECQMKSLRAWMILERLRDFGEVKDTDPPAEELAKEDFAALCAFLHSHAPTEQIQAAVEGIDEVKSVEILASEGESPAEPATRPRPSIPEHPIRLATQTAMLRINVQHLDLLLNLVSELVINQGQLLQATRHLEVLAAQSGYDDEAFHPLTEALDQHNRTLDRLHEAVLQARTVPMSHVFDRFPRMMRDLLHNLGKEADFEIEGRDVEMDRTTLEALAEPLMHLLRNAADHGLETPQERLHAGKPRRGRIRLSARRDRGQAVIEVEDDGGGIDADRILETAIQRGLVVRERAHELNRHQTLMLICHPGFSLASQVTDVSGRGVGMDVVKRQIDALQGSMDIETTPGEGSIFRLQIPLSLALAQALMVKVGSETYAVPLHHIEHTIDVIPNKVQRIHRWEIMQLEDQTLPLFSLGHLLDVPNGDGNSDDKYALVVRRGDQRLGLVVDEMVDKEEIVIKPMPKSLTGISGLSGTTIVGTGQVVLILDVPNLIQNLV